MINIIHQIAFSGKDMDGYIPPNKDNLKEFLPNAEYNFWDLPRFTKLLKDDGATDVLNAINNIKPYAYKSDIARYYLIHKTGGWYVDQNNYFTMSPWRAGITKKEFVVFGEGQGSSGTSWAVQNSLFYAAPRLEVMRNTVEQCIQNVKDQYYGFFPSCPTGPNLFGSVIASQRLPANHNQLYGQWLYWPPANNPRGFYLPKRYINLGDNPFDKSAEPLALYKPYAKLKHATGQSGIPGGNNYWDMWNNKQVY